MYRIVVLNSTTKRSALPKAQLGYYNPVTKDMKLDKAAALEWIKNGAQPTSTVAYLIKNCTDEGKLDYKKKTEEKLSKKAKAKLEAEAQAKAEAAAAPKEEAPAAEEAKAE